MPVRPTIWTPPASLDLTEDSLEHVIRAIRRADRDARVAVGIDPAYAWGDYGYIVGVQNGRIVRADRV